jgi:hypothetical protein
VKDINGKSLKRDHYILLKELGVEIVMYDVKPFTDHKGNQHYAFDVQGCLTESVDFDEILALLRLMKLAKNSTNPAIIDAMEHLKLVIGITDESK